MVAGLNLEDIIDGIASVFDEQLDSRDQDKCQYRLSDAGLAAFSVFYTQSPSFLSHQRDIAKRKGRSNAQTVFSLERIPSDTHIRTMLDGINADVLSVVYRHIIEHLQFAGDLESFHVHDGGQAYYLLAMDGTEFYSSAAIGCEQCSTTERQNDKENCVITTT